MVSLVRSYRLDVDMAPLMALLERRARAGLAEAMGEDVLHALAARQGFEPTLDAFVAPGPSGTLLGWADVHLAAGAEADLLLAIDMAAGDEVRSALLDAAIERARKAGATSMLAYARPADVATLTFLDSRGAQQVAGYVRLRAELARVAPAPPLPTGTRLKSCGGPAGAELALAAMSASWGDLVGHKPSTPESVASALEVFGFDGQLVLVDADSRAVGVVRWLQMESGDGYVDAPGLAPHLRSRDNYAALLGVAASRLSQLGAHRATLESWGDPPEARAAWAMLGWEIETVEEGRQLLVEDWSQTTVTGA